MSLGHKPTGLWKGNRTTEHKDVSFNHPMYGVFKNAKFSTKPYCIKRYSSLRSLPPRIDPDYHFESDTLEECQAEMGRMKLIRVPAVMKSRSEEQRELIEMWF